MREVQKRQLQFGQIPVDKVWLDPSRDDIPAVLKGLQHLYKEPRRSRGEAHSSRDPPTGVRGWRRAPQGLGCDFDRLHNLAPSNTGHSDFADKTPDNCRPCRRPEVGRLVVESGHAVARKKPGGRLRGRCDSIVVETDVHYPTDLGLLWDGVRCRPGDGASGRHGVGGWRQHRHLGRVKEGNPVWRGKQTPENGDVSGAVPGWSSGPKGP